MYICHIELIKFLWINLIHKKRGPVVMIPQVLCLVLLGIKLVVQLAEVARTQTQMMVLGPHRANEILAAHALILLPHLLHEFLHVACRHSLLLAGTLGNVDDTVNTVTTALALRIVSHGKIPP